MSAIRARIPGEIRLEAGPYSRGFGGLLGLGRKRLQISRHIPEPAEFPAHLPVQARLFKAKGPVQPDGRLVAQPWPKLPAPDKCRPGSCSNGAGPQ
jgi:hypothetical protein